jgi:flagellar M-ring protein FliF
MSSFWQEVLARPRDVYSRLSRGQRLGVLALASVAIVVAILSSLLAGRESFALLYGGLDASAAQEVCSKLTELGVHYRLSPDGSMVQVPEQRVAEAKMQLAGSGLPKLGSRGFELFDENQLGLTDSLFNVNLQRALQGELEKSIETLAPVKGARVLVNLPPQGVFQRDASRATASVTLWLRPGMPLSDSEVAAIAHIVAAAVGRGIRLPDVTIVDSEPRLLHPRGDENDPMFSAAYLQKVQALERYLQEKAESQLRAFGEGKALVRVAVELDLTHKETALDQVTDENQVPVKEATTKHVVNDDAPGGDPSTTAAAARPAKEESGGVTVVDEEKEYRTGMSRELTIAGAGSIRRMTVSLLLDENDETLKARKAEIEKAVKSAVGFSEKRPSGLKDELNTVLAPFAKPVPPPAAPGPFALENLLPLLGNVAEGVTVLFVLVLLARTLRGGVAARRKGKGATAAGAAGGADGGDAEETEADVLAELQFAEGKGPDLRARLGRFVNKHPDAAREVLVAWLKEEVAS